MSHPVRAEGLVNTSSVLCTFIAVQVLNLNSEFHVSPLTENVVISGLSSIFISPRDQFEKKKIWKTNHWLFHFLVIGDRFSLMRSSNLVFRPTYSIGFGTCTVCWVRWLDSLETDSHQAHLTLYLRYPTIDIHTIDIDNYIIYIYVCVCACVCLFLKERKKYGKKDGVLKTDNFFFDLSPSFLLPHLACCSFVFFQRLKQKSPEPSVD